MTICKTCSKQFEVVDQERDLCKKLGVPEIPQCHECRRKWRMLWRNEIVLYNNVCGLCEKDIVAMYPKGSEFPVYCEDCWWSDKWNGADYGIAYKNDVPFFEQFSELIKKVPRPGLAVSNNTNCAYVNFTNYSKGTYFTIGCKEADDCLYAWRVEHSRVCVDSSQLTDCERCFELIDSEKCYNVKFSKNAVNCNDSAFLLNCQSCSNCFGCANLVRQSYCIFNKKYSKEEYLEKIKEYDLSSFSAVQKIKKQFTEFALAFPRKFGNLVSSEECAGDTLSHCKNVNNCFSIVKGWNCCDVYAAEDIKDTLSCDTVGWPSELSYNSISAGCVNSYDVKCSSVCWTCARAEYCDNCHSSEDIFGCVGLKKNQYYILNKQYSKKEYAELKEKIIAELKASGEYGFFFPPRIAPHAYNESIAQDYYPLTREEAVAGGFRWSETLPGTKGKETIKPEELPDKIAVVEDSIVNQILACVDCKRNYKIIKQELSFYRKEGLPLPRKCPQCRIRERLHMKNLLKLWHRKCSNCTNEFETTYAPERKEKVFCESCYTKEVL